VTLEGVCSLTGRTLQALQLSAAQREDLFRCTAQLANHDGHNKQFRVFQRWFESQEPYDVVIDGANVGFNNQNREGGQFQYEQIDIVLQHFRRSGQRALLVLHPKWLKEDANLAVYKRKRRRFDQVAKDDQQPSPDKDNEEDDDEADNVVFPHEGISDAERAAQPGTRQHLMREWKESGSLLCVPFSDCDDWYWLYAALDSYRRGREHVQVVSNDLMRDHHWRMYSSKAFLQWQDRHMTRVFMQTDAEKPDSPAVPQFYPPRPYSLCAQVSEDGQAWHFPVPAVRSRAEQLQSGRPLANREVKSAEHRWLVAWQTQREHL